MNNDQINNIAETIARIVNSGPEPEIQTLRDSIDKLSARLDKLESSSLPFASKYKQQLAHQSLDRFAVAEAIAHSIFGPEAKEMACTFEPDRPCDHCSMCSSRGF